MIIDPSLRVECRSAFNNIKQNLYYMWGDKLRELIKKDMPVDESWLSGVEELKEVEILIRHLFNPIDLNLFPPIRQHIEENFPNNDQLKNLVLEELKEISSDEFSFEKMLGSGICEDYLEYSEQIISEIKKLDKHYRYSKQSIEYSKKIRQQIDDLHYGNQFKSFAFGMFYYGTLNYPYVLYSRDILLIDSLTVTQKFIFNLTGFIRDAEKAPLNKERAEMVLKNKLSENITKLYKLAGEKYK